MPVLRAKVVVSKVVVRQDTHLGALRAGASMAVKTLLRAAGMHALHPVLASERV
jgi:hypothetical protein